MSNLPLRWKSPNGSRLKMRLMRPDDAESVKNSLNQLSPLARRHRFFGPVREFTDPMVSQLVDVDPARVYPLVVLHRTKEARVTVGGGRFVIDETGKACEFSLVIIDDWQGQGIGRRILGELIAEATRRGLQRIIGDVLAENPAMFALGRSMGFMLQDSEEGPSVKRLIRTLPRRQKPLVERFFGRPQGPRDKRHG
ncbi:MAG: GNAT family N-acetyltransferase [Candidatus Dechloromonas phosphoritropha]